LRDLCAIFSLSPPPQALVLDATEGIGYRAGMARPLRIEPADGLFHVTSCGNEQRAIVRDDADRQRPLDWLERTSETYGRVLGELGKAASQARRTYGRFLRAGQAELCRIKNGNHSASKVGDLFNLPVWTGASSVPYDATPKQVGPNGDTP
jgi:hypothetical protein